jgi:hypothetical protein
MKRHLTGRSIAWPLVFTALLLWLSAAPMPGWWVAVIVIVALLFGLANRYPHLMPRWLAAPTRQSR